jgi:ankyrin repeat protein
MLSVVPIELLQWSKDDWVADCISGAGKPLLSIINDNIDMPVTRTGSTLLHLATMTAHRPNVSIAVKVISTLLEWGANPNAKDDQGRTPLTNLITQSSSVLHHHEELAVSALKLLFTKGADGNVLFTPDFIKHEDHQWTLAHDLLDFKHGGARWSLPKSAVALLNIKLDFSLPDSRGQKPLNKKLIA